MAGHTGDANEAGKYGGLVYLPIIAENNFTAEIPEQKVDLIYLCFPNNPTGAIATKEHLKAWVDYAKSHNAIIFFDAAYEAFITDESLPHSIYEMKEQEIVRSSFALSRKMPVLQELVVRLQ